MIPTTKVIIKYLDISFVFIFSFILFILIINQADGNSDLQAHVRIAKNMYETGNLFSGNFLMYLLLNVFSFFSCNLSLMNYSLSFLLGLSVAFKYQIVKKHLNNFTHSKKIIIIISLSLLIVYIIPLFYFLKPFGLFLNSNNMYLGYYVPNIWHNSTLIFLFPFAILLYLISVNQLHDYNKNRTYSMTLLIIINILIKPSFFFIFLIAFPVIAIFKFGLVKSLKYFLLPILIGLFVLSYVFLTIYNGNDGSHVKIIINSILTVDFWITNGKYIAISILLPVVFFICNYKKLILDWEFYYLVLLLFISLVIYFLCHETGPRASHGNFYWQIIISMWLVFLFVVKVLFFKNEISITNLYILKSLYTIHVFMGVIYILKLLITQNFT